MSDRYVDEDKGNDDNDGLTVGTAKKTLAAAYDLISSGDTIQIMSDLTPEGQAGNEDWKWTFDKDAPVDGTYINVTTGFIDGALPIGYAVVTSVNIFFMRGRRG